MWVSGLLVIRLFFFFKQKTAYEMRISDWSSDVCSSDLLRVALQPPDLPRQPPRGQHADQQRRAQQHQAPAQHRLLAALDERRDRLVGLGNGEHAGDAAAGVTDRRGDVHDGGVLVVRVAAGRARAVLAARSEEHTSELQALMR